MQPTPPQSVGLEWDGTCENDAWNFRLCGSLDLSFNQPYQRRLACGGFCVRIQMYGMCCIWRRKAMVAVCKWLCFCSALDLWRIWNSFVCRGTVALSIGSGFFSQGCRGCICVEYLGNPADLCRNMAIYRAGVARNTTTSRSARRIRNRCPALDLGRQPRILCASLHIFLYNAFSLDLWT